MFRNLLNRFIKKRPELVDLLFGNITFYERYASWFAGEVDVPGKLSEFKEFSIVADEAGPTDAHRIQFRDFCAGYDVWIRDVRSFLCEDYDRWCDFMRNGRDDYDLSQMKGFPILETLRAVLDHAEFFEIRVYDDGVYLYAVIEWEEEHNRAFTFEDGRFVDWESV